MDWSDNDVNRLSTNPHQGNRSQWNGRGKGSGGGEMGGGQRVTSHLTGLQVIYTGQSRDTDR